MVGGGGNRLGMERPSRAVTGILVLCGAVFLLEIISVNFLGQLTLIRLMALTPELAVRHFHLWQPFTYVFLHDPANLFHILFNALMLWWFASPVERQLGMTRFVRLFVFAAAVTGVAVILAGVVFYWLDLQIPVFSRALWSMPTLGISGVGLAFFTIWALEHRNAQVLFMLFVPMRGITMLWVSLAIEGGLILTQTASAWPAHLAGFAFGAVYVTWPRWHLMDRWRLWRLNRMTSSRRKLVLVQPPDDDDDEGGGGAAGETGRGGGGGRWLN